MGDAEQNSIPGQAYDFKVSRHIVSITASPYPNPKFIGLVRVRLSPGNGFSSLSRLFVPYMVPGESTVKC